MGYCKICGREWEIYKFMICNDCSEAFHSQTCYDNRIKLLDSVDEISESNINNRLIVGFALLQEY